MTAKVSSKRNNPKRPLNLALVILTDLLVNKWVVLLVLGNLVTALLVVQFAHLNRQAFIEQDRLFQQRDELDIQWRHNLLEQRTLAEHNRVEAVVSERLGLYRPSADDEVMVTLK